MRAAHDEDKHLAASRVFCGLDETQIRDVLEISHMEMFDAGAEIFAQGDASAVLYVVLSGSVRISIDVAGGEEALAILGPGESFGEMAVFSETRVPRSAAAIAHTDATLLAIERDALHALLAVEAELARAVLWNIVRALSECLRATTGKIVFLAATARF
jgi:CRP-like cAMP-binding protein